MKALFIVVNAGYAEEALALARQEGIKGATVMSARGEGMHHESFMGISINTERDIILCVVEEDIAKKSMALIKEKLGPQTPAHCICFTIPIEHAIGLS